MKRYHWIIIFLLFTLNIPAQTFEVEFSTNSDEIIWDVYFDESDYYYCVGHTSNPATNQFSGLLLKLSPEGKLIKKKEFTIPGRTLDFYGIGQDTLNSFIIFGKSSDTTIEMLSSNLELKRINYDLDVIDSCSYIIDKEKGFRLFRKQFGKNNDLLITGGLYSENPPTGSAFYFRLSSSFDSIHFKQAQASVNNQIWQLSDSTYWVAGLFGNGRYKILDFAFNYVNHEDVPYTATQFYGLKWDSDSSFFMTMQHEGNNIGVIRQFHPLDVTDHIFLSLDFDGQYDYQAPIGALDFQNKDSVFVGGTTPFYPWGGFSSHYVVLQTDSLLNIRWERFYGEGNYYYELTKVLATKDGGCILAGTRYDYNQDIPERDIYIVKLNNEGLIVGNEEHAVIKMSEAIVYPNPGTNEIKIRIAAQHPESLFKLYDMNGKLVVSNEIYGKWGTINTTFLKSGTYIYRITNEKGLFESGKWVKQ